MYYTLHRMRFFTMAMILLVFGLSVSAQVEEPKTVEGVIRVKLEPELLQATPQGIDVYMHKGVVQSGISQIDALNMNYDAYEMVRLFRYSPKFEAKHRKYGLHLWYEIRFKEAAAAKKVAMNYSGISGVQIAEPVYHVELKDGAGDATVVPLSSSRSSVLPFNDPSLIDQWHYNNDGIYVDGSTEGADINLFKAWETTTGSSDIIISIHDQGFDIEHEDLMDNIWVNEAELNGEPGVDDDGNGYRDDIYGFNFAANNGTIDAMDHGSHVGGTVAAVNNNGIGVAGVAGGDGTPGSGVKIMACQILNEFGGGTLTPESFVYAADMGAVISQNSWGYSGAEYYNQADHDAIDYFIAEAGNDLMNGGVVIFAAGNSNSNLRYYPGAYEPVMAVSALNFNNNRAGYSNYGDWVEISAPGGYASDGQKAMVLSCLPNSRYGYMDGTSMACPHVSGVAGLALAANGGEGFTNEDLKNQLLTSAILVDTVPGNEEYANQLGVGAIDASLAVASDEGIAPDAIDDLVLNGIAQDFASIGWSVPADGDDERPVEFEIIWSTEEITLGTIELAKTVNIPNGDDPGTAMEYEISGLQALTKYYFAVRSIDRWGNISDFSNIVSDTTNEGPDASVDPTSLSISIDASVDVIGSDVFDLINSGEGLLKWTAEPRHISNSDAWSNSIVYPELKKLQAPEQPRIHASEVPANEKIVPLAQEYISENWFYYDTWQSLYLIGETDLDYSNSGATKFTVFQEEGFNLTQVRHYLNLDPAHGPVILEVYRGETLDNVKITYAQEYSPWSAGQGTQYINLNEQIFFEQGESFWIVIHVPAGNEYPLAIGLELEKWMSDNCYMSFNMGKSWSKLEDVWNDNRAVWAVHAYSDKKALDSYVTITPNSGEVASATSEAVTVSVDATDLITGTYNANVVLNTNDFNNEMIRIPVSINVTGHSPNLVVPTMVDFGSVMYGKDKTLDIILPNIGLDRFRNPTVTISNPEFTNEGWLGSIAAQDEATLTINYTPSAPGNANALVNITSSDGHEVEFVLVAVAAEPPVAVVNPADTSITGLAIGDVVNGNFRIRNDGNYPLTYYIPAYSDENIVLDDPTIHKFGYVAEVNPALYNWTDISTIGTDVTALFDGVLEFKQVSLGFEFPFFGETEDSLYITPYMMVSFDPNSSFNYSPFSFKNKWKYNPDRFISAWANTYIDYSNGGKVYYKNLDDKFVIQYNDIPMTAYDPITWEQIFVPVTLQIVLFDNGDVAMHYQSVDAALDAWALGSAAIGIEDQIQDDALIVNDNNNQNNLPANGMSVYITNPGLGIFSAVDNTEGTILAGDSVTVNYTVETDRLTQTTFAERLSVVTNDPFNNPAFHTVNLEITSGGVSDVSLSHDTIRFGQVFQNGVVAIPFLAINDGTLDVTIDDIRFNNDNYTVTYGTVPNTLKAKHKLTYELGIVSSTLGVVNDTVTVETNEGQLLTMTLIGEIIEAPQISTDITVINETMPAGDSTLVQVAVTNNGGNNLEFYAEGTEWLYLMDDGTGTKVNYTYVTNKNSDVTNYNWIDITETGERDTLNTFTDDPTEFFVPVELPWSFDFYGNTYDSMYIGGNGFISFDYIHEFNYFWGPSSPFPDTVNPNNFIAPMYFFGGMDYLGFSPKSGVYHEFFEDKIVVTWQDHMNNFGMGDPVSFQAILYKDGRIKFQYNMGANDQTSQWGAAGIENEDGTEGLNIYYRSYSFIEDDMAIMISPANTYEVAPTESRTFDVLIDGRELYGGTYNADLVLHNNVPGSEDYAIPATLTLTGDPAAEVPALVDLGEITAIEQPGNWAEPWKAYEYEFELKNTGKAVLDINNMYYMSPSFETVVYEWYLGSGWFGPQWGWYLVDDMWSVTYPQNISPNNTLKLKAVVAPTGATSSISDTLVIECAAPVGTIKVAIEANVILPPSINIGVEEISLLAVDNSFTADTLVVFDNINGKSDLNYSLRLDFGRVEEESAEANAVPMNYANAPDVKTIEAPAINAEANMETYAVPGYNRTLEYDTATVPASFLGYGGDYQFVGTTKFIAPSDGFNLTHVMTWFRAENMDNPRITVEIRGGADDPNNSIVLASQVYEPAITAPDEEGMYHNIELEENIVFFPNEVFYVSFYYPININYPQAMTEMDETIFDRYYFGEGEMFYDLGNSGITNAAWMHKALEFEYQSGVWTEITSAMSGNVPVGESDTVHLHFDAMYADPGLNTANLVIESNDPITPEAEVVLNLIRNRGPQFKDAPELILEATEGVTSTYFVEAVDLEGDEFVFSMDAVDYMTATQNGNVYELTFAPDHDAEAQYLFEIVATDTNNNSTMLPVTILVQDVNRAPVVTNPVGTMYLYTTVGMEQHNVSDIFMDPDGDVLTVTAHIEDDAIVDVPISNTSQTIWFQPVDLGTSQVVLTATDTEGASVNDTISVIVGEASSVNDPFANTVKVYPNPTSDFVQVDLANVRFDISLVRIVDAKGAVVYEVIPEDNDLTVDLQTMAKGAYYLEIIGSDDTHRELIIKQ